MKSRRPSESHGYFAITYVLVIIGGIAAALYFGPTQMPNEQIEAQERSEQQKSNKLRQSSSDKPQYPASRLPLKILEYQHFAVGYDETAKNPA